MFTFTLLNKLSCLLLVSGFTLSLRSQTPEKHKDKILTFYIESDPLIDDPTFKICSDTLVYPYFYISTSYREVKKLSEATLNQTINSPNKTMNRAIFQ